MTANDRDTRKTHRIEGTDDLLFSTIKDQAADLEHGWREAIQNGIDSPGSTLVTLEYDAEESVIKDDGDGVDLTVEDGVNLLTNLGESSKSADDDTTIGEFGIGKGQIIAKAVVQMESGDTGLLFDIENNGLEVEEYELSEPVDGLKVVMDHYDDEVPGIGSYRWETYQERIEDRFRFVGEATGVDVKVNGELISDDSPEDALAGRSYKHTETYETDVTGPVHIAVAQGSDDPLSVYSRGVHVKDVEGRGLTGVVVTERNLDLNFARNDIKSGCPVWSEVSDRLDEIRQELFSDIPDNRLVSTARDYLADTMFRALEREDDWSTFEDFKDRKLLRTANESRISVQDVLEKSQIGYSHPGDGAADRLSEAFGMTVLDETDSSVKRLRDVEGKLDEEYDVPEEFSVRQKAEDLGVFTGHERLEESELRPQQRKKLAVARELAGRMGVDRDIDYGESDVAAAWTDGYSYIVITDGATPSSNRLAWIPEMFETIVHEYCHDDSTKEGCSSHGRFFDERYREAMEANWPVLSEFLAEAAQSSVKDLVGE